ncbi:MAG: type II secretion system F family protein, partial [Planctomycetaceae bacterium]|nr:type II secretion system F family protein [Planctomycetaceae bacterium]
EGQLLWLLTLAVERGIPIDDELEGYADAIGGTMGLRLRHLADRIDSGATLADELVRQRGLVSRPAALAAKVGEQTGTLAETLRAAAIRSTGSPAHASRASYVVGAVAYLWIIGFMLMGVASYCAYYIVPKMKAIFEDFDVELPLPTRMVIDVSDLFVRWGGLTLPLLLALVALCIAAGECYRRGWQNLSLPWLTRWFPRLDTPEILRNLARGVGTSHPLPPILKTLAEGHHRPHISERLSLVHDRVVQGEPPWSALQEFDLLRPAEVQLLAAAEQAGNLPWALHDVANRIERNREHRWQWWFEFIRPWPILLLGLLVGIYVAGMFLPIVKLITELS